MIDRVLVIGVIAVGLIFSTHGIAAAGPCDAVKKEMAYGQAAVEDAKDQAGFRRAATEFQKAADKAPKCAAAFFNLGVVQEKAGNLNAAKSAYERYLKLSPKAADAGTVEQQVFKLEYRIKQKTATEQKARSQIRADEALAHRLRGRWAHPKLTLKQDNRIGRCNFRIMQRGYLIDLKVTGAKVEGIVIGTPYLNTTTCKAYHARTHVPFLEATVKNGKLIGKKYDVRYGGGTSGMRHGSAKKFEWKIDMAPDGRSFKVTSVNSNDPKPGSWNSVYLRR